MSIDIISSGQHQESYNRPKPGFGGVVKDSYDDNYYIGPHWTWVDRDGSFVHDKYIGPGPLINQETGETIERNRPGSPYVELDFKEEDVIKRLNAYTNGLNLRLHSNRDRHLYGPPEIYPLQEDIERYILARFIDQCGTVNIWDTSLEIEDSNDGQVPFYLGQAYDSFISCLGLEILTKQSLDTAA